MPPRDKTDGGALARLPWEILKVVSSSPAVGAAELCALSASCKRLHTLLNEGDEVWRLKLDQEFAAARRVHTGGAGSPPNRNAKEVRREYAARHIVHRRVYACLADLAERCHTKEDVDSDAINALLQLGEGVEARHVTPAELETYTTQELAAAVAAKGHGYDGVTLTHQYYARKALRSVRQTVVAREIDAYMSLPEAERGLEAAAGIVARWCQPFISISNATIATELDELAATVQETLGGEVPDHPALVHPATLASRTAHPLTLSNEQGAAVLEALNQVMFRDQRFRGNQQDYYNVGNSMINQVLESKRGIPITLSIVYASVARRLGVRCEPLNFPGHFLLKWMQQEEGPEGDIYIDAFNGGTRMSREDCARMNPFGVGINGDVFEPVAADLVLQRMVRNLVNIGKQFCEDLSFLRGALELAILVSRESALQERVQLCTIYIHSKINLAQVKDVLASLPRNICANFAADIRGLTAQADALIAEAAKPDTPRTPKRRDGDNIDVDYCVGQIMYHKRYKYYCVVYGWDPECKASWAWIVQMGVNNLPKQHHQPFYNVLVDDGSVRYAAQESLTPAPEIKPVTHRDVGKYFERYTGKYYVPNAQVAREYPEDAAVIERLAEGVPEMLVEDATDASESVEEVDTGLPLQS